jgi:hypothetical protein
LALVALGALAFLYVSGQLSTAVPVIAVVNDVQRGAVIGEGDVGMASVVPDPALAPVPADRMDEVVGLRAATDLVAGTLLTDSSVTAGVVPATGEAVVGVPLTPGQMPGEPLLPGDVVLIVGTPGPGDGAPVRECQEFLHGAWVRRTDGVVCVPDRFQHGNRDSCSSLVGCDGCCRSARTSDETM